MPTHEECYWAMLALNALDSLNVRRMMDLASAVQQDKPTLKAWAKLTAEYVFRSRKTAYGVTPKHWLGPSHDPSNPECQAWRRVGKGILSQVLSQPNNPS